MQLKINNKLVINKYGHPSYVKILSRGDKPYPTIMRSIKGDAVMAEMFSFGNNRWERYFDLWEDEVFCGVEGMSFEYISEEEVKSIIPIEDCVFTQQDIDELNERWSLL